MFMCSGQLFSQGDSARSWQTPARQRLASNVVLELVVEMPQGGQERVGRRLSEPAERRVADHPPEFVEVGEILLAPLALGDAGEDAQRLVQPDPAGRALAAGFGAGELE